MILFGFAPWISQHTDVKASLNDNIAAVLTVIWGSLQGASLHCIGLVLFLLDKKQDALIYYEQSLKFYKKVYGDEHLYVRLSLSDIGAVLSDLGKKQEALTYHEQSLVIYKKVYGDKHPSVARTLNNMSEVLDALGRRVDAARAQDEASKIA